jgi:hypothetical protein
VGQQGARIGSVQEGVKTLQKWSRPCRVEAPILIPRAASWAVFGDFGCIVTPSAVSAPSPTPDPEVVRKTAGTAYLAAAGTYNKATNALEKKYPTFTSLARARAFYRGLATIQGAFIVAIKKIVVPADTAGDLHSLVARSAADQALAIEGSAGSSWSRVDSVISSLERSTRTSSRSRRSR